MSIIKSDEGLKRVVGAPALAMSIVNGTIGAGIFALPAVVGIQLGAFSLFSYLFCGVMLAAIMLCYAEIGSRLTTSGGSYAYVESVLGPLAGFIVNWLFFFGWGVLSCAALLNIIADSLTVLYPVFSNAWIRALLYTLILGQLIIVNVRGAKQGIFFVQFITIIKVLPLAGIILFGFSHIQAENLRWEQLPSIKTFADTALILFFAFAGFETSLGISGELKNPKRTVPLGLLLGGTVIISIYILLQTVTQGVLGATMVNFKSAPLAAVANEIIGPVGATILLFTAAISCFGSVGGDVFATPRMIFAGAKDGLFPKYLASVHTIYATPHLAVITYASLIFILSISGGFKQLAILASSAILLIYMAVIVSTLVLRSRKEDVTEKAFRVPGGWIIPVLGIVSIIWLLSSLTSWELLSAMIFITLICIGYFMMKKWPSKPTVIATEKDRVI
jgi:amino acid transporter